MHDTPLQSGLLTRALQNVQRSEPLRRILPLLPRRSSGVLSRTSVPAPSQARRTAAIAGLGHYLPAQRINNHDLARRLDTSDEWIRTRTGISARRNAAPGEATSDLAAQAALAAIADARIQPSEVDLILLATSTPDQPVPATAAIVQAEIGARQAAAMDIGAGCCGFIFAAHIAAAMMQAGAHERILIIGSEVMSRFIDDSDRQTCALFGDGAGAAIIAARGVFELIHSAISSDGRGADLIQIPAGGSREPASQQTIQSGRHYVHMRGNEVFRLAVRAMVQSARAGLDAAGLSIDEIALVIPHQANARILEAVGHALRLDPTRMVLDLAETANTSAASIPLAMSRAQLDSQVPRGGHIMTLAFGAGLCAGCQVWRREVTQ